VIADQQGQTVWRWDNQEPFGSDLPNDDPGNTGTPFVFNLRFPGQYFDRETFTHYNVFRDYDPGIGRYVQPDPLGVFMINDLTAAIRLNHLYTYANSDPLRYSDELGLVAWCGPPPCQKVLDYRTTYSGYCPRSCALMSGYIQWWTCWPFLIIREPRCICSGGTGPRG
jgi:RHS repeat-associated protein